MSPPLQALDCTLPEGHPYHQACGLRAGSDASLVRVCVLNDSVCVRVSCGQAHLLLLLIATIDKY
jgi:hypothetical protein